jgi:hypothetical protein
MRFGQEIRGNLQVHTITVLHSTKPPGFQLRDWIIAIASQLCFMKAALPMVVLLIWESLQWMHLKPGTLYTPVVNDDLSTAVMISADNTRLSHIRSS